MYVQFHIHCYNSAKDVPLFYKWGLGQITGGEHISRLVEAPTDEVLPTAKPEQRRYNIFNYIFL